MSSQWWRETDLIYFYERRHMTHSPKCFLYRLKVDIHKPRGQIFGYFWHPFVNIFTKKSYVVKWSFGLPPSPQTVSVHVVYGYPLIVLNRLDFKGRLLWIIGNDVHLDVTDKHTTFGWRALRFYRFIGLSSVPILSQLFEIAFLTERCRAFKRIKK